MEAANQEFEPSDARPLKVFFQDEATFGRISSTTSCWAPPLVRPLVPCQIVRQFMYVFSALCPTTGDNFALILPQTNSSSMQIFLDLLSENYSQYKLVLVADQASWHKAKDITIPDNIRMIYLPPRSPELNPVEHLWKYLRENHFHNRIYSSLDTLEEALIRALRTLTNHIIKSFTGFHWILRSLSL